MDQVADTQRDPVDGVGTTKRPPKKWIQIEWARETGCGVGGPKGFQIIMGESLVNGDAFRCRKIYI